MPAAKLQPYRRAQLGEHQGAYYVRLLVEDRPGVMAFVARQMADRGISLESVVQRRPRQTLPGSGGRPPPGEPTPVVIVTYETTEGAMRAALDAISVDGRLRAKPQMIRIEKL
jgi:homoserine dehydrogenase